MFRHQQLFIPSLVSLSNYTKGALLYGVFPVCALCETERPRAPECPGCFASLRSEQGAALPCAAMRLSLQTVSNADMHPKCWTILVK